MMQPIFLYFNRDRKPEIHNINRFADHFSVNLFKICSQILPASHLIIFTYVVSVTMVNNNLDPSIISSWRLFFVRFLIDITSSLINVCHYNRIVGLSHLISVLKWLERQRKHVSKNHVVHIRTFNNEKRC